MAENNQTPLEIDESDEAVNRRFFQVYRGLAVVAILVSAVVGFWINRMFKSSNREIVRFNDYEMAEPVDGGDLIFYKDYDMDSINHCEHIIAIEKSTGKTIWTTVDYSYSSLCVPDDYMAQTGVIDIIPNEVVVASARYWVDEDNFLVVVYGIDYQTGDVLWQVEGSAVDINYGITLLDYRLTDTNAVFVVSNAGLFFAVDPQTGEKIWDQSIPIMNEVNGFTIKTADGNVFLYLDEAQTLSAYSISTGQMVWQKESIPCLCEFWINQNQLVIDIDDCNTGEEERMGPPIDEGVYSFDTATGKVLWKNETMKDTFKWMEFADERTLIISWGSSGYGDFTVPERVITTIESGTGKVAWQYHYSPANGYPAYLVEKDFIVLATVDNQFICLDVSDGEQLWRTDNAGIPQLLAVDGNTLVVIYQNMYASGFDIHTGKQKWILDVGATDVWNPENTFAVQDGILFVAGDRQYKVRAIDTATGEIIWQWGHFFPSDHGYKISFVDDQAIYINQCCNFGKLDWTFALKTKP